ncbi:MAG: MscL family protein [Firmicutes bacterium]|nr:MscL family protein [Bacillota bacterium]
MTLKGFKKFLLNGNIVVMAVGFIVALAFSGLVKAFTSSIVSPIISRIQGKHSIGLGVQLGSANNQSTFLNIGAFLSEVIYFLVFMAVVYFFIVMPYKKISAKRGTQVFADPPPVKTCPACLSSDILLAATKCKYCGTDLTAQENS